MSAAARNKNGQASPSIETTHPRPAVIVGPTLPATTPFPYTTLFRSGGSISWKLYDNKTCSSSEGGLIASDGPVAVSGNGDYSTPAGSSPTQAGTYYWVASYSGDANNKEARSEERRVGKEISHASPSNETTKTPPAGIVGATFKDKATIAGLFGSFSGA